jgi:hypothetical protein
MVWGLISRKNKRLLLLKNVQIGHAASYSVGMRGWVVSFAGVKLSQHEVDRTPPSTVQVKNEWGYNSAPSIHLHGADRDNFILTFLSTALNCLIYLF